MKPHWQKLMELIETHKNGSCEFKFQDGLPVKVLEIKSEDRNIDLTDNKQPN